MWVAYEVSHLEPDGAQKRRGAALPRTIQPRRTRNILGGGQMTGRDDLKWELRDENICAWSNGLTVADALSVVEEGVVFL